MSLFKLLTRGASFDKNRFLNDAIKIQMVKTAEESPEPALKIPMTTHIGNPKKRKQLADPPEGVTIFSASVNSRNLSRDDDSTSPAHPVKIRKKSIAKNEKIRTAKVHQEEVNRIRNANRIHIWGVDIPDPIQSFVEIVNFKDTKLWDNVNTSGYLQPTPVQMQAIPILMAGREVLACAPTGSGKTLAFLLPLISNLDKPMHLGLRAVVVVPSLELSFQIYKECVRLCEGTGLKTSMIDKNDVVQKKYTKLSKSDILVTTPNRLIYLLKTDSISMKNVVHLIVDECDRLFESGFREQLGTIYSACDSPYVKRSFFSATCSYDVEEFCKTHLDNPIIMYIGSKNAAVDLIQQDLIFAGTERGKLTAFRNLITEGIEPPVLVFVQSQDRADELLLELKDQGLKVQAIHAGKTKGQRENTIETFRQGKTWILICTTVLSRGVDFPAVKLVVNYDLPQSPTEYIHSVGRTGRAGRRGRAVTFFTEDDRDNLRRIAQVLSNSGFPVPPYVHQLPKIRKDKSSKTKFQVPKRDHILRRSKYDLEKKKRRLQMIRQSKTKQEKKDMNEATDKQHAAEAKGEQKVKKARVGGTGVQELKKKKKVKATSPSKTHLRKSASLTEKQPSELTRSKKKTVLATHKRGPNSRKIIPITNLGVGSSRKRSATTSKKAIKKKSS